MWAECLLIYEPTYNSAFKLLVPEIRHTVSNLSQVIHFLVDNDFLDNVELQPGDADSQLIKVLDSTDHANVEPGERSLE
jgi:hypothetical protein